MRVARLPGTRLRSSGVLLRDLRRGVVLLRDLRQGVVLLRDLRQDVVLLRDLRRGVGQIASRSTGNATSRRHPPPERRRPSASCRTRTAAACWWPRVSGRPCTRTPGARWPSTSDARSRRCPPRRYFIIHTVSVVGWLYKYIVTTWSSTTGSL